MQDQSMPARNILKEGREEGGRIEGRERKRETGNGVGGRRRKGYEGGKDN